MLILSYMPPVHFHLHWNYGKILRWKEEKDVNAGWKKEWVRERQPSNKSAINGINFLSFKGTLPSFYGCAKMDLCLNRGKRQIFYKFLLKHSNFFRKQKIKSGRICLTDKCDHTRLFMFNACELNSHWHNILHSVDVVTIANVLHMLSKKSFFKFPIHTPQLSSAHMVQIFA